MSIEFVKDNFAHQPDFSDSCTDYYSAVAEAQMNANVIETGWFLVYAQRYLGSNDVKFKVICADKFVKNYPTITADDIRKSGGRCTKWPGIMGDNYRLACYVCDKQYSNDSNNFTPKWELVGKQKEFDELVGKRKYALVFDESGAMHNLFSVNGIEISGTGAVINCSVVGIDLLTDTNRLLGVLRK